MIERAFSPGKHHLGAKMKITDVEPILLRGDSAYRASAGAEEATDNGDWQLLVRVATDEGLTGWADVETLGPAAVAIIAGQSMSTLGFRTLRDLLIGENPLDVERLWDKLYVGSAYYGRRWARTGICWWIPAGIRRTGGTPANLAAAAKPRPCASGWPTTM
jgi:L-alanine-DL-glutamate epimerase-like enolase superfamily enzyme